LLLVNADDFGQTKMTTDRIIECYRQKRLHSASLMVFMKDSARAAALAKKNDLPVGLHLNLTQELTGDNIASNLKERHKQTATYLKARKLNQLIYTPYLRTAFNYVFQAQWDEFCRLYGSEPSRLDGHHHMHLCLNILFSRKVPKGIRIRRNFTFGPGEKSLLNRLYRHLVDRWLTSQFLCTDSFFSITPINKEKLRRLIFNSWTSDVEIMVHPGEDDEYLFLLSSEWANMISV